MAEPRKPHSVWLHDQPGKLGGKVHHIWGGEGSTHSSAVSESLKALAAKSGVGHRGLHVRLGRHADIHVFASEADYKKVAGNEKEISFRKKVKKAPQELFEALMDIVEGSG